MTPLPSLYRLIAVLLLAITVLVDPHWAQAAGVGTPSTVIAPIYLTEAVPPERGGYTRSDFNAALTSFVFRLTPRFHKRLTVTVLIFSSLVSAIRLPGQTLLKSLTPETRQFQSLIQDDQDPDQREKAFAAQMALSGKNLDLQRVQLAYALNEQNRLQQRIDRNRQSGEPIPESLTQALSFMTRIVVETVAQPGSIPSLLDIALNDPHPHSRTLAWTVLAQKVTLEGNDGIRKEHWPAVEAAVGNSETSLAARAILKVLKKEMKIQETGGLLRRLAGQYYEAHTFQDPERKANLRSTVLDLYPPMMWVFSLSQGNQQWNPESRGLLLLLDEEKEPISISFETEFLNQLLKTFLSDPETRSHALRVLNKIRMSRMTERAEMLRYLFLEKEVAEFLKDSEWEKQLAHSIEEFLSRESVPSHLLLEAWNITDSYPDDSPISSLLEQAAEKGTPSQWNEWYLLEGSRLERLRQDLKSLPSIDAALTIGRALRLPGQVDQEKWDQAIEEAVQLKSKSGTLISELKKLVLVDDASIDLKGFLSTVKDPLIRDEISRRMNARSGLLETRLFLFSHASPSEKRVLLKQLAVMLRVTGRWHSFELLDYVLKALKDPDQKADAAWVLSVWRETSNDSLHRQITRDLLSARDSGVIPIDSSVISSALKDRAKGQGVGDETQGENLVVYFPGSHPLIRIEALRRYAQRQSIETISAPRAPTSVEELFRSLDVNPADAEKLLGTVTIPGFADKLRTDRRVWQRDRVLSQGYGSDLLSYIVNKQVRFQELLMLYADPMTDPALRLSLLRLMAQARELNELFYYWPAIRELVRDLRNPETRELAATILGKVETPELSRIIQERIVLDAPEYYADLPVAQPLIQLLEQSRQPAVLSAATRILAQMPSLHMAVIGPQSSPILTQLLVKNMEQPALWTIFRTPQFADRRLMVQIGEALIKIYLGFDNPSDADKRQSLEAFLRTDPRFKTVLDTVADLSIDPRVRQEALRLQRSPGPRALALAA